MFFYSLLHKKWWQHRELVTHPVACRWQNALRQLRLAQKESSLSVLCFYRPQERHFYIQPMSGSFDSDRHAQSIERICLAFFSAVLNTSKSRPSNTLEAISLLFCMAGYLGCLHDGCMMHNSTSLKIAAKKLMPLVSAAEFFWLVAALLSRNWQISHCSVSALQDPLAVRTQALGFCVFCLEVWGW